ncbi:uncharacterized protein [Periplaneta americana]|uniref:uncharacterized protein isoform X3 n=1 Tax=Periplaneta americana TaxID=6978 RepID=UPI0037E9AAE4
MAWYLVCLISIVAVAQVDSTELPHQGTNMAIKFEKLGSCENFPNGDIKLSNISTQQIGRNQVVVSGQLDVKVPVDEKFKLQEILTRCNSKFERGNCEEFPPSIFDLCEHLAEEDKVWSGLVHHLENFTPKCPVPPGSYAFHNLKPIIVSAPLLPGYWIAKYEGFIGKDRVMCFQNEMSFNRQKDKSV